MGAFEEAVAGTSSVLLRLSAYCFLRWIPSRLFPPIIYSMTAIYLPTFFISLFSQVPYNVLQDNVKILVEQEEVEDEPPITPSTADRSATGLPGERPTHIEEQVDVEETILLEEKSARPWKTLLTGIPSPTSNLLSLLTFLINVGLALAVADLIYRAKVFHPSHDVSFARMGYISPTEANLLVREPDTKQLPVYVSYRQIDSGATPEHGAWKAAGTVHMLGNDTDFTAPVKISLPGVAGQTFQWATSNNHTGYFTTPPKVGDVSKNGDFTFLTSSCIKPRFPYNPLKHPLHVPGFKYMADVMKSIPGGAQFMLFLGDFIYIDVPLRLGDTPEDYRREYRQAYASPDWPLVGQNLSWIHVLDDHEIANDWDKNTTGVYQAAASSFHHYQASVNPPVARKAGTYNTLRKGATYFEFTQGPATFFMIDTRTHRDSAWDTPADHPGKTMLGKDQLADLLAFLERPVPAGVKWKFLISSIPFTKNFQANAVDTWAGYLDERQTILESMWDVGLRGGVGVVVLTGDRHQFAATAFPPPLGGKWPLSATVNEFSVSPLSQFYLPIPNYWRTDDDIDVKYIINGNSKLGAITISHASSDQSMLKYRVYVDGQEVWSSVILSPPIGVGSGRSKDSLWG